MKINTKVSKKAHKARSSTAEVVHSNDDLLTEILLRLPIKSLIRFKLVSMHWLSLITSSKFCLLRSYNPSPSIGLFLPSEGYGPNRLFEYIPFSVKEPTNPPFTRLNFIKDPPVTEIRHSCNGLLLCCSDWDVDHARRFFVFNPSTKKYSTLPEFQGVGDEAWIRIHGMCLAFDPTKSPHYKVVVVWGTETEVVLEPYEYQFEVYSSETGRWRMCYKPFKGTTHFDSGVYWNGAINWFSFYTKESFYFNLEDEVFEKMPMPPIPEPDEWDWRTQSEKLYFGESYDHLHYVGIFAAQIQFDVYEMKRDYSEWFVKYKVDLLPVVAANPGMIWDCYDPIHAYYYHYSTLIRGEKEDDSFLVLQIPGKAIRYNIVDKTFEVVYEFVGDEDQEFLKFGSTNGFQYIESLSSV